MYDTILELDLTPEGARKMATDLANNEYRGKGDTYGAAFARLQSRYSKAGLTASMLDRLTSTCRDIQDMKLSSFAAIAQAYRSEFITKYQKACDQAQERYEQEREAHAINPILARLADKVAGLDGEKEG